MFSIKIPIVAGIEVADLKMFCWKHDCDVYKHQNDIYYTITSEDPLNFFWLGMNFNHSLGLPDIASELKKQKA